MVDPSKIQRHVAHVNSDAWFIKLYLWLWAADVENIDFCRLFWGYVFAVPMMVLKIFLMPIFWIWDGISWFRHIGCHKLMDKIEWVLDRTIIPVVRTIWQTLLSVFPEGEPRGHAGPITEMAPAYASFGRRKAKEPSKFVAFFKKIKNEGGEMFLSGVGKTADRAVATGQSIWPYVKWVFIALGIVFATALALVTGYLLFLLIRLVPTAIWAIGVAFAWAGNGIAFVVSVVWNSPFIYLVPLVILGIICIGILLIAIAQSRPAKVASEKTAEKALGFGGAMKMGVKSVKYRTCPVIKIEEKA